MVNLCLTYQEKVPPFFFLKYKERNTQFSVVILYFFAYSMLQIVMQLSLRVRHGFRYQLSKNYNQVKHKKKMYIYALKINIQIF